MVVEDESALVGSIRDAAGSALRSIATYDQDGYEMLYVRDDVAHRPPELAEAIHQNLVLEDIETEYLEGLFAAGDLQYTVHRFEDLAAFHIPSDRYTGLFVSVDPAAGVTGEDLASAVRTHV